MCNKSHNELYMSNLLLGSWHQFKKEMSAMIVGGIKNKWFIMIHDSVLQ